jgi:hypothetical protein
MLTLAERLKLALERLPEASMADLAKYCGVRQPSVSDWFRGETKTLKANSARLEAEYLQCRREWLETGLGDPGWLTDQKYTAADPAPAGVAQPMSLYKTTVPPPTIAWEGLMNDNLPTIFRLEIIDDAMAPDLRRGDFAEVDTSITVQPGDVVLVRDSAGNHALRKYHLTRPGEWSAVAANPAYGSMDSRRDGLSVVAVLVWEVQRPRRD